MKGNRYRDSKWYIIYNKNIYNWYPIYIYLQNEWYTVYNCNIPRFISKEQTRIEVTDTLFLKPNIFYKQITEVTLTEI